MHLEDALKKTREKTSEHEKSRELLRQTVKERRVESLVKMKSHNEEIKSLENEILNTGMQMTAIQNENVRFQQV
jgi:hypothetical protein